MLQEKPDNSLPWRDRLDQLESLPAAHLTDKLELWEKLHGRLQETSSKPLIKWYWLVAACLLLVFMLPLIYHGRQPQALVKSETIQLKHKAVISHKAPVLATPMPDLHMNKEPVAKVHPRRRRQDLPSKRVKTELAGRFRFDVSTGQLETRDIIAFPIPDQPALATSVPAKKKLKVVHINEIEHPEKIDLQTGSQNATAVFQIPRQKQVYTGGFESTSTTSADIFKIKLSPSN